MDKKKISLVWRAERSVWRVGYYDNEGKKLWRSFKEKEKAEEFIESLGKNKPKRVKAEKAKLTLGKAAEQFLETKSVRLAKSSIESYSCSLSRLSGHFSREIAIDGLTTSVCERFLIDLVKNGLKRESANSYLRHYRAIWSWLVKSKLAKANVWKEIELFKTDPEPPSLVPPDRVLDFLAVCTPNFRPIAAVAVYAGLRRREIIELAWRDIDLDKGFLLVRKSKSHKPRIIPIHSYLKVILEKLPRKGTLVFPGRQGKKRYDRDTSFNKATKAAAKKIGLTNVTFHGLRATCATRLAAVGVGETIIRDILGHHDTAVTRIYLGLGTEQLRAAIDRVE